MTRKNRVVITGLGAVTSLGHDFQRFSESIKSGSNPRSTPSFLSSAQDDIFIYTLPKDLDLRQFIKKKKAVKIMSRTIQLAVAASRIAFDDACFSEHEFDSNRSGVSVATGVMNYELEEMFSAISKSHTQGQFDLKKFGKTGLDALFPLWALKYIPNMPACHISIENDLKGPSNTQTSSNASGLYAMGEAMHIIQRGDADVMLAGGTGSNLDPLGIAHLQKQGLLRNGKSSGIEVGEGSAALVLESYEKAKKRKAKIYGEILAFASNHDLETNSDDDAKLRCMEKTLKQAGLQPKDVDFVITNQCGYANVDDAENRALDIIFGKQRCVPTVKMKDWFGYVEHASSAIEACFALFCANQNDKDGILKLLARQDLLKSDVFLVNAFGLYGHNSSLMIKKYYGAD